MAFKKIEVAVKGTRELLMHNGQMADPLNEWAVALKEVSGKRSKTDEDHREMARIEFMAGLYWRKDLGPYIPAENLEACLRDGAKEFKQGKKVATGILVAEDAPLIYDGPRDPEALFKLGPKFVDRRSVVIGKSRVVRTRPVFRQWGLAFTLMHDPEVFNRGVILQILTAAGSLKGLGDWRGKRGLFEVASAA